MRVCDVQAGTTLTVELAPLSEDYGVRIARLSEANVFRSPATSHASLCVGDASWEVQGATQKDQKRLDHLLDSGLPRLAWVETAFPTDAVTALVMLQVRQFPAQHIWPENIDLGVDDKVLDQLRRKGKATTSDEACQWLTERFLITAHGEPARALVCGSATPHAEVRSAFRLVGHGCAVDIIRAHTEQLEVVRVVELRRPQMNNERRPVYLAQGRFRFVDTTVAGTFHGVARSELDQIVKEGGSYLRLWREYNDIERQFILRRARELGWIEYARAEELPGGRWRFHLLPAEDGRTDATLRQMADQAELDLEAAVDAPRELCNGGGGEVDGPPVNSDGKRVFAGAYVAQNRRLKTIDLQLPMDIALHDARPLPPSSGVLFVSLSGDRIRLRRREQACAVITQADCPMPQLGMLLEDRPAPQRRSRTIKALSGEAKAAFGGEPTPRQEEALRIALNTPDIALIQGPPGTGKTRVIAALQARLAQEAKGEEGAAGLVLITSYQHDAVENAASATQAFGLPAIRVGGRRTAADTDDPVDRWRRNQVSEVTSALAGIPDNPASAVLRKVRALATAYLEAPKPREDTASLLTVVEDLAGALLPQPLLDQLLELRQSLSKGRIGADSAGQVARDAALSAVRGLRTDAMAFSDDGPLAAYKALKRLHEAGVHDEKAELLLRRAADHASPEPLEFLDDLRSLQARLETRLLPDERPAGSPTVNTDVERLLGAVVNALYDGVRQSQPGVADTLTEFRDDLEYDVNGAREAVTKYATALAATCQQSVSRHMEALKGDELLFDTVVVDEAARANPLDLFIPMSLAQRRIILVGDHRQLPHVLEPEVEQSLDASVEERTREAIRMSLFERLFSVLRKREGQDGVRRTVTLDVQYRMHPVLGHFVSDTFYRPYGEAFGSGQDASSFEHGIPGYGDAVAVWKHIPLRDGRETGGRSKSRQVEAVWLAKEVTRLCTECHDLSIGVISFYAAQVEAIQKALCDEGLTELTDDGTYRVVSAYRETRDRQGRLKERLRVGTVDAFQGKEFDVVLLSMTRSNDYDTDGELALRRKYGHLMLENRLCVAMSRQKRVLVVVGDSDMLDGVAASRVVRGLVAFRTLTGSRHGIRL